MSFHKKSHLMLDFSAFEKLTLIFYSYLGPIVPQILTAVSLIWIGLGSDKDTVYTHPSHIPCYHCPYLTLFLFLFCRSSEHNFQILVGVF